MEFKFADMNYAYASEMINNWKYKDEYSIYDYCNEKEELLDESLWGLGRFAVLNEKNNLIGELTIEFFEEENEESEDDGYVEYETILNDDKKIYEMWMGWGLKPELCGKGLGKKFILSCIEFAVKKYDYHGDYIRCAVAEFNKRAIKVYEKLNFETFEICNVNIENKETKIFRMKKMIKI